MEQKYDIGILMSSDSDLVPALETVYDLRAAHVETAAWSGVRQLRLPEPASNKPFCHFLNEHDFDDVRDWTDYLADRPFQT